MKWRNYKHRFVPWIAINWSKGERVPKPTNSLHNSQEAIDQLCSFIDQLSKLHPLLSPREIQRLNYHQLLSKNLISRKILMNSFGFDITIDNSRLKEGGRGVFVNKGTIKKGQLVALYPGTLYLPADPILFQSINNSYILRCVDGIHVDGKNTGLSRLLYRSCAFRDLIGRYMSCDITWLSLIPINPLSIGQIINNATKPECSNVQYIELDLPILPLKLQQYIPNVYFQPHLNSWNNCNFAGTRTVGILATKDIPLGEELYSLYFTVIDTNNNNNNNNM